MFFSFDNRIISKKNKPLRVQSHISCLYKKRTSRSASHKRNFFLKEKFLAEDGGVTVEAAIVLPLLLSAFVGILLWGKVFLVHQEIETALLETARQLARQEAMLTLKDQEGTGILGAAVLFSKNRKQGDEISGIEVSSVSLLGSEYREGTKEIYLKAEYIVKIPVLLLGTWRLPIQTSVIQKAWNGYVPRESNNQNREYVYITEQGVAYHRDSQCYHLHVAIEKVTDVHPYYRGEYSYRPCEYCVSGRMDKDSLYLSEDGECYHEDLLCRGLKRTVKFVAVEFIDGRRPCSDCCGGG